VKALKLLSARLQNSSPVDREKIKAKTEKSFQGLKFKEYVNNEYGFMVTYDADLLNMANDTQLISPLVIKRRGLKGLPVFAALVDDIPRGMALEKSADYLVDFYKKTFDISEFKITTQKPIKLSGGLEANYFEIKWKYQSLSLLTVGVFAYKNNKIIGAFAGSTEKTSVEYLALMVKSLKFIKQAR